MNIHLQNWAGNYRYQASRIHYPESLEQLQEVVKNCGKAKSVGTRHSFNHVGDTSEALISLERLQRPYHLNPQTRQITVGGNVRYGELGSFLYEAGYALPNLASLPHISVVGACATGTHGSGLKNGNLATAVAALEFVTADGSLLTLSRAEQPEQFAGAVVSLGGLGVAYSVTLDLRPSFDVRQLVYEQLPHTELVANFAAIMSAAYSVSLFTNWQTEAVEQVWLKQRLENEPAQTPSPTFYQAALANADRHPILTQSAEPCTPQMGVPGPWHERLPHFKLAFTPSNGEELQSEYFVPLESGPSAFRAIWQLREKLGPHLFISEIRTIAADDMWLSPCYQRDSVAFHFTWHRDWTNVQKLLPLIEEALRPFQPRPHWGKLFTLTPAEIQAQYKKLPAFRELLQQYDPKGKFRNVYLENYIFRTE
ncbi:MAG: FAD-binding protein [Anaerolineales bacterium]|nr:FAD-binding protein [Anaerolineales bacterium]